MLLSSPFQLVCFPYHLHQWCATRRTSFHHLLGSARTPNPSTSCSFSGFPHFRGCFFLKTVLFPVTWQSFQIDKTCLCISYSASGSQPGVWVTCHLLLSVAGSHWHSCSSCPAIILPLLHHNCLHGSAQPSGLCRGSQPSWKDGNNATKTLLRKEKCPSLPHHLFPIPRKTFLVEKILRKGEKGRKTLRWNALLATAVQSGIVYFLFKQYAERAGSHTWCDRRAACSKAG